MQDALKNAAPLQTTLMGRPWQVLNPAGMVLGHYASGRVARDTSVQFPGSTVRFVG